MTMQPIARDYVAPEGEFSKIEDGNYLVEQLSFMEKSIDKATGKPKLTDGNFGLQVMFDVSIVGNEDTIPLSCSLAEIPFIVQAFTNNAGKLLPPVPALDQVQAIEAYLLLAVQVSNEGKNSTLTVKKGWGSAYRFNEGRIPIGNYHGYFVDILTKNQLGLPSSIASAMYPDSYQFDGLFLIVADQYGDVCGWSGTSHFQKFMGYKAEAIVNEKQELVTDWLRVKKPNSEGKYPYTATAKTFSIFVDTTAPSLFGGENIPQWSDARNICPEWLLAVQRDRVLLNLNIKANKKGYPVLDTALVTAADISRLTFDINSVSVPAPRKQQPQTQPVNVPTQYVAPIPQVVAPMATHLEVLRDLLNLLLPDQIAFDLPFPKPALWGDVQKEIVTTYVISLKEQLSVNRLNDLTLADVGVIFDNLPFNDLEPSVVAEISAIYARLEVADEEAF